MKWRNTPHGGGGKIHAHIEVAEHTTWKWRAIITRTMKWRNTPHGCGGKKNETHHMEVAGNNHAHNEVAEHTTQMWRARRNHRSKRTSGEVT
jgi:hypothetical protein